MKPLRLDDKCYKFFMLNPKVAKGPRSISYKPHKCYIDDKIFFFRKDEAIASLKDLIYFMGYGDALVEVVVNQQLINNAIEVSPHHFVTTKLTTGDIFDAKSNEMQALILEALRKCEDFSDDYFSELIKFLIINKAFDSALTVYNTIKTEKGIGLTEIKLRLLKELSSQHWRNMIPLAELSKCKTFQDYINLLKATVST